MGLDKRTEEPETNLERLGMRMVEQLPEGVQAIIMLDDDATGGMVVWGYEEGPDEAVASILSHTRSLMRQHGADLMIVPGPNDVSQN